MCTGDLNGVGAVARVLNGEDGLVSRFSRPIDPCSGGATGAQNYHSRASPCLHSRGHQPCDDHASVCNRRAGARTCFGCSPQPAGTFDELILNAERAEIMAAWSTSPSFELGSLHRIRRACV